MLSRINRALKLPVFLLLPYVFPFAFLLWFVTAFGVNVPYADQWALVPLFQKIVAGKATFQDFFAQHNEHRIVFSKLILSALAFTSGWNIQWELYFSVALAAIVFFLLFKLSFDQTERHDQVFHLANISTCFIVFSVVQWENWLWGFQLAWFFVDACLVMAILALSSPLYATLRVKLAVAATACLIASFSLAHGLLLWLAVLPSLRSCCKEARQFRTVGLLWATLFFMTCLLYFIGYHKPPSHPDVWFFLKHPTVAATYFLTLLGSPLLYSSDFSMILGGAALLNFGFFGVRYVRNMNSAFAHDAAPWLSLGCFAILFDLVTTVGRVGFGVDQAKSSRYTTVAILLLVALVQLWRLTWQLTATKVDTAIVAGETVEQPGFSPHPFAIGILTFLVLVASINSLPAADGQRSRFQYGQACLAVAEYVPRSSSNCLQWLYPDTNMLLEWTKILNQIGFRHFDGKTVRFVAQSEQVYGYLDAPAPSQTAAVVRKSCLNCSVINVSGWAILPAQSKPAHLVLIGQGNNPETFFTTAYVNLSSPDVAKALGAERYHRARWQTTIAPELLPLGKTVLTAWVYDPDGKQFVKLRGEPTLSVEG